MEQENGIFKIVTEISEEQRKQLYTLIEEFEDEYNEKNKKLPAKASKINIFHKLFNKFKDRLSKPENHEHSKNMARDILEGKKENSKLFMLCEDDKLVGFEMAQISKDKDKIVGWKPWLYIQKELRNTNQEFINERGEKEKQNVVLYLDRSVEDWFAENGVNYQKTSTGINMLPNIVAYVGLGFKPVSKNRKTVFLEKDMENPLSKQKIRDIIKEAQKGNICVDKENIFKKSLKSGLSLRQQKENSDKFMKNRELEVKEDEKDRERKSIEK